MDKERQPDMKTLLAILLLAALPALGQPTNPVYGGAAGTTAVIELPTKHVVVKFTAPSEPMTCPPVQTVGKNEDGSYSWHWSFSIHAPVCYSGPREWYEFWTDYPDRGGKFIGKWERAGK